MTMFQTFTLALGWLASAQLLVIPAALLLALLLKRLGYQLVEYGGQDQADDAPPCVWCDAPAVMVCPTHHAPACDDCVELPSLDDWDDHVRGLGAHR